MLESINKLLPYFISCTVGMAIIYDFMSKMYQPRFLRKSINIILYSILTALWIYVNHIGIPILNFTYFTFICLITGFFLNKAKHIREFMQIVIFIISYVACDTIISCLLSVITGSIPLYSNNSILFLFNVIVVLTFTVIMSKFLIILFKRQEITYAYKKKYIFLAILPMLNIITICAIFILPTYKIDQATTYDIIMLMSLFSGVLNLAVIYFFDNLSKSYQLENSIILMQQRMDMQYSYYQKLDMEYSNSQKIMHDIKNHIKVLERLYKSDQYAEGLEYAIKIDDIVEQSAMKFKCNNQILNIIVNEKMRICELKNIDFIYSVENLDIGFIEDIDATTIFANLLDNAIEACEKVTNDVKQIELRLYQFNNMIIINIINSIENMPTKSEEKFISNKKGHKAIGLSNVEASIKKYDGDLNIEISQGKFSVSIMFPGSI
jgi:two-component system, LytTR family, sensor histidine kinase AgrC